MYCMPDIKIERVLSYHKGTFIGLACLVKFLLYNVQVLIELACMKVHYTYDYTFGINIINVMKLVFIIMNIKILSQSFNKLKI